MFIGIILNSFLSDFGPKWSGNAPNGVMMGDKCSQTPYGDFWTDSGTHIFLMQKQNNKTTQLVTTYRSRTTLFWNIVKP